MTRRKDCKRTRKSRVIQIPTDVLALYKAPEFLTFSQLNYHMKRAIKHVIPYPRPDDGTV